MPYFELELISVSVSLAGNLTGPFYINATTNFEALYQPDDGKIIYAVEDPPGGSTAFIKGRGTSLLIRLNGGEPEPIPLGFVVTNAKIYANVIFSPTTKPLIDYINFYFNGSFIGNDDTTLNYEETIFISKELTISNLIILSSFGCEFTVTEPGTILYNFDYLTIRGDYVLWSTLLAINPTSEIQPGITEITITDGENQLTPANVDQIKYEYLDTDDETIISTIIDQIDFVSQAGDGSEIVFILPILPSIPDCTLVTISLIDAIGLNPIIGTIFTECEEPNIEIPGEEIPDPEDGLSEGLGYGGLALHGSVFGDDTPFSFSDLIDFGVEFRGIGFGGSAFENDMAIIFPDIDGGLDFGGTVGDSLSLMGDVSGIYTLVPGQTHDILYDRQVEQEVISVKIPDPFIKTGYVKK